MRLSGKQILLRVMAVPEVPSRPIRVCGGGLTFRMTVNEAIELANQLVDTAESIKTEVREQ